MTVKSKKYNDLINTARDLFWKYGFKRVSIEEVCRESKVSKMTFYKFFPNKIELAKTIFNRVVEDSEIRFREIMQGEDPPADKLKKVMLLKLEGTNNISPEFMQDFYMGREPELKAFVEQRTREAWEILKSDYEKAQKEGIFRKDFKPELLIKIQYKMIELMEDESVTGMYNSPQDLIMEFANLLVYGMLPYDE